MTTKIDFQALVLGTLITVSGYPVLAATTPSAIWQAETGVFIGAGRAFQHDTETLNNTPIDSEKGALSAYTAGLMGISRHTEGLYWRLNYTWARGSTHYEGNAQMGYPAQATTSNTMNSADGRLGFVINGFWQNDGDAVLIPYIGLGLHRWARSAARGSLPGGPEYYSDGHMGIGLRGDYVLTRHWVLALYALTGYTLGAQVSGTDPVSVDTATGQVQNASVTEALGDRPYSAIGAKLVYLIDRHWQITFHARRARWAYGASAPIPITNQTGAVVGDFTNPDSTTTQTLLILDIGATF